jgi:hypothetical protein
MRSRRRVFVGCEGDSERAYARWLQTRLDANALHYHLNTYVADGGDPLSVVQKSARECRRRQGLYGKYFAKAVFLDTDKIGEFPARDDQIVGELRSTGMSAVYQIFDHEAFLLRHFEGQSGKRPGKSDGMAALRRVWPSYKKSMDARSISSTLSDASLRQAMSVEPDLKRLMDRLGFI